MFIHQGNANCIIKKNGSNNQRKIRYVIPTIEK